MNYAVWVRADLWIKNVVWTSCWDPCLACDVAGVFILWIFVLKCSALFGRATGSVLPGKMLFSFLFVRTQGKCYISDLWVSRTEIDAVTHGYFHSKSKTLFNEILPFFLNETILIYLRHRRTETAVRCTCIVLKMKGMAISIGQSGWRKLAKFETSWSNFFL